MTKENFERLAKRINDGLEITNKEIMLSDLSEKEITILVPLLLSQYIKKLAETMPLLDAKLKQLGVLEQKELKQKVCVQCGEDEPNVEKRGDGEYWCETCW